MSVHKATLNKKEDLRETNGGKDEFKEEVDNEVDESISITMQRAQVANEFKLSSLKFCLTVFLIQVRDEYYLVHPDWHHSN